jgi:peptidoglycan/LPS O-acetylase OafA/YrhL
VNYKKGYIPSLDGWRGLAVISVILYHGRVGLFKSDSLLMRLSAHGDIGVDVFFALSGFLICGLLLKWCSLPSNRSEWVESRCFWRWLSRLAHV